MKMWRLSLVLSGCSALVPGARSLGRSSPLKSAVEVEEAVVEAPAVVEIDTLRFLSEDDVRKVRATYGSPCFVYDAASLRARAAEALAFPSEFGLTARYAMKSSPNAAIIGIFDQMGMHFDASSTHECRRAMLAGVDPTKISLSTQQLDSDFAELVEQGVLLNACSLSQLEQFAAAFPEGRNVGVRFNPGLGSGGTSRTNVGGCGSSFGIWHAEADAVLEMEQAGKFTVERVHTHIGSGSDPEVWQRVSKMSLDLCEKFESVATLNLGGGYKVGRMSDEKSTVLSEVGAPVCEEFAAFKKRTGRELKLEIEPGTFLVANAASLVTTVQDVVSTTKKAGGAGRDFLKLDCGMTEILRPSLYGAQHPLVVVSADSETAASAPVDYVVVGHCCESGDLLTPAPGEPEVISTRALQPAKVGDVCVIESVGAYCSSMAAIHYNSFPEAPEILKTESGDLHCIRQRSSLDQIVQNEVRLSDDLLKKP